MRQLFPLISALSLVVCSLSHAELPPLIPREILFGKTERAWPVISPDGPRLAFRAPDTNKVLQVWVKTMGKDDEKIVTANKRQGVYIYFFAKDNQTLLYTQGRDGDENDHLYGVDLVSGDVRDYTPFQGVRVSDTQLNLDFPDTVLDTKNPGDVASSLPDRKFQVRAATAATPQGGTEVRARQRKIILEKHDEGWAGGQIGRVGFYHRWQVAVPRFIDWARYRRPGPEEHFYWVGTADLCHSRGGQYTLSCSTRDGMWSRRYVLELPAKAIR